MSKFKTPVLLTWTVGILAVIGVLTLNLDVAAELCNYGTFTSFIIVCVAVLILRHTDPDRPRPFKVPFCPWFPLAGILSCSGLMIFSMVVAKGNSTQLSTELFIAWIIMGALIYASYGYHNNRKAQKLVENKEIEKDEQIEINV